MRGRGFVAGGITFAILRAVAACSSFGAAEAPSGPEGEGGVAPESGADARAPGEDASASLDGGCGGPPFVGRFAIAELLSEGWKDIAQYGPQGELSVAHATGVGDGVLRARAGVSSAGRGKVFYRDVDATLTCLTFEVRFRVDERPSGTMGVVTTVLRFESEHWVGITFTPKGDLEIAQQTTVGGAYQALGRVEVSLHEWHVARIAYREGPVVEASLDDVAIPLELNTLYPFARPHRFDVGVTYAAAESAIRLDVDEVRVF